MAEKAKHAFGESKNLENAISQGLIDAYDILFLDGDTDPKIGWIDKSGNVRIAEDKNQIIRVEELPSVNGDENVVYIYNNEGYIWNGTECVSISKAADLTGLEAQLSDIELLVGTKVDETTVDNKIEVAVEAALAEMAGGEVVEF